MQYLHLRLFVHVLLILLKREMFTAIQVHKQLLYPLKSLQTQTDASFAAVHVYVTPYNFGHKLYIALSCIHRG